jgi:hypothetical protein
MQENGLCYLHEENGAPTQLNDENSFEMPCFDHISDPSLLEKIESSTSPELEDCVENLLRDRATSSQVSEYFIAAAHEPSSRERLGFPDLSIRPDDYLLRTHKHYPGIHSSYGYISSGVTFAENHREDFGLSSINIMFTGTQAYQSGDMNLRLFQSLRQWQSLLSQRKRLEFVHLSTRLPVLGQY